MQKCDIRKKIMKMKNNLKEIQKIKLDDGEARTRQIKDIRTIKEKIEELEKQL